MSFLIKLPSSAQSETLLCFTLLKISAHRNCISFRRERWLSDRIEQTSTKPLLTSALCDLVTLVLDFTDLNRLFLIRVGKQESNPLEISKI